MQDSRGQRAHLVVAVAELVCEPVQPPAQLAELLIFLLQRVVPLAEQPPQATCRRQGAAPELSQHQEIGDRAARARGTCPLLSVRQRCRNPRPASATSCPLTLVRLCGSEVAEGGVEVCVQRFLVLVRPEPAAAAHQRQHDHEHFHTVGGHPRCHALALPAGQSKRRETLSPNRPSGPTRCGGPANEEELQSRTVHWVRVARRQLIVGSTVQRGCPSGSRSATGSPVQPSDRTIDCRGSLEKSLKASLGQRVLT